MRIILSILISFCIYNTQGQQLTQSTISPAGHFEIDDQGQTISGTLGEVFTAHHISDQHLTGGFQQGDFTPLPSSKQKADKKPKDKKTPPPNPNSRRKQSIEFSIFPNPTTDRISVQIPSTISPDSQLLIINSSGQVLYDEVLPSKSAQIHLDLVKDLPSGTYFVQVIQNNHQLQSYPFLKL